MSTGKFNNQQVLDDAGERFAQLARMGEQLFHAHDLGILWGITNKNTLYTTLKRYVQRKLLYRVYKGLYSLVPFEKIDPVLLGVKALHTYCYVSTETVLARAGIIMQHLPSITYVSSVSRRFTIREHSFISRKFADRFLYNPAGIEDCRDLPTASAERAVADLMYVNPRAYFDNQKAVDWDAVRALQREIGYPVSLPNRL